MEPDSPIGTNETSWQPLNRFERCQSLETSPTHISAKNICLPITLDHIWSYLGHGVKSWYLWAICGLRSQKKTTWNHHVLDVWTDSRALGAVHCRPGKAWRLLSHQKLVAETMVFFSDLCLMFEEFLKMSPEVRSLWTAEVLLLEIFHLTLKQFGWMLPWVIRQKTIQNHGFPMISPGKSPAALQHAHARHGKIG